MKLSAGSTLASPVGRFSLAASAVALCFVVLAASHPLRAAAAPVVAKTDLKAGETNFMQKCYQCHSIAEGETRVGPSLYHELKKPKPKKTDAEVRLIIKNGKNKMPAWGSVLSAQDTDNLLAYLHTL